MTSNNPIIFKKNRIKSLLPIFAVLFLIIPQSAYSQGSIFGTVNNSDLSTPQNGQIMFYGYLDDTDEEIRLDNSIGAGYDAGNWFDDFQNYLTEAPGNPYDYHFFNIANGESAALSKLIPNNSFQQEDIQLVESAGWPSPPQEFTGVALADSTVRLGWQRTDGITCRLYRRPALSSGSFFRIDDPSGDLSNPGVTDSIFIDSMVDNISEYTYLIIPIENGIMGVYSDIITIDSRPPTYLCGDASNNGAINILDATYIINYLYKGGPAPDSPESADPDGSGTINILDVVYLINFLYKGGPEPIC